MQSNGRHVSWSQTARASAFLVSAFVASLFAPLPASAQTDQVAAGDHCLDLAAELTAGLHLGPQQIAGGEMQQALAGGQALGLGAFAGAGRTKEEEALLHGWKWAGRQEEVTARSCAGSAMA